MWCFPVCAVMCVFINMTLDLMMRYNAILSPSVQPRDHIAPTMRAQLWTTPHTRHANTRQRLKVGLLSSDFGVHPVATLIRGFVQFVDTSKIELYCFALTDKRSWWGINISKTAEHFINLASTNTVVSALGILCVDDEFCTRIAWLINIRFVMAIAIRMLPWK